MAYSDAVIYQALARLLHRYGTESAISLTMISMEAGASASTTFRALARLRAAGLIQSYRPTPGVKCRYRIVSNGSD